MGRRVPTLQEIRLQVADFETVRHRDRFIVRSAEAGTWVSVDEEELALIGQRHQVLCITHLPQIAAAADTHYRVDKQLKTGRTMTEIELLDNSGRETEIARMLGATEKSVAAVAHAKEMLRSRRKDEETDRINAELQTQESVLNH